MFDVFMDYVKKLLKSRLFPISVIYLVLFAFIISNLFVLQIVKGPATQIINDLKYSKEREIKSTRGNIYDCKGVLLAYNKSSYSVVMEDITTSDEEYNKIVLKLVNIIEKHGDTLDNEFFIKKNSQGDLEFVGDDKTITRFKKNVYAFVLSDKKELTEEQKNASAQDVFEFLQHGTGNGYTHMFDISDDYTVDEALKIMSVRYALFIIYPKYLQITIASNISDATVAAIVESNDELQGVEIQQRTSRVYNESEYFAHIIGYTGLISDEELDAHKKDGYNPTDVIGKTGLEKHYEDILAGKKGTDYLTVNSSNRVIGVENTENPIAGNDIYLTIDSNLQKYAYLLLEKEIAKILLDSIVPDMNYGSKGESATDITIPIFEVYNALINNNTIDISAFTDPNATVLEKETYDKYRVAMDDVIAQLDDYLSIDSTTTNDKAGDMKEFLDYFFTVLTKQKILDKASIPADDTTYKDYIDNKISLSKFLQYALANNWVDLKALNIGDEYYSAEELYQKLMTTTKEILKNDDKFNKLIYRNLVFSYKLSGTEICLLLFDQGVLKYSKADIDSLNNRDVTPYNFILGKIKSLEITPAMLALDPCNGSVIITDVKTGEVRAMVSYPGYDNNMLANKVDADYYSKLLNDKSEPLWDFALKAKLAPGSTFKMVTTTAALQEGVTTTTEKIYDEGIFDKISPPAKCHIYPSSHGYVDIEDALKVSCNYFFYEMGYKLSLDNNLKYIPDLGLSKLAKYAGLFGLNQKSGIELDEAEPMISTKDAVRSAIGQGSNDFTASQLARYVTTIANRGTCFDLTLLDKIEDKDGKVIEDNKAVVDHQLTEVNDSTWDAIYQGMYDVVNAPGGSVVNYFQDFGVTIAGKTGTSQISLAVPNNALFLSFAPYDDPKIAVTVVIPCGYTSHNAAELSKSIYSLYYGMVDPQVLLDSYTDSTTNGGSAIE